VPHEIPALAARDLENDVIACCTVVWATIEYTVSYFVVGPPITEPVGHETSIIVKAPSRNLKIGSNKFAIMRANGRILGV
jgi:hypothetical protein